MKKTLSFYFHRKRTVLTDCENDFRSKEWRVSQLSAFVLDPGMCLTTRFMFLTENRFMKKRICKWGIRHRLLSCSGSYVILQWSETVTQIERGRDANSTNLYRSRPHFTQEIRKRVHEFVGRTDGLQSWNTLGNC